jgi:hypothetical protein
MDSEKLVTHWPRESQKDYSWQGKCNGSYKPSILIHVKFRSYETSPIAADAQSRTSSPGCSGSGSDSRPPSRPHSRSRPAPPILSGVTQAAKRFQNTALTLDFTSASGGTADQSIEDEMNHYMSSSLPARKSTDMIGYWMVWCPNYWSLTASEQSAEPWQSNLAKDISSLCWLRPYPSHFSAFRTSILILGWDRY